MLIDVYFIFLSKCFLKPDKKYYKWIRVPESTLITAAASSILSSPTTSTFVKAQQIKERKGLFEVQMRPGLNWEGPSFEQLRAIEHNMKVKVCCLLHILFERIYFIGLKCLIDFNILLIESLLRFDWVFVGFFEIQAC